MNYLENMGENLELLDLVKKCNVTTYSLRSIRDKNTAIKNLKGLRVEILRVSPSYMRENPCELVKTEVLNHAEAVETINLLGEEDTLNLEEMILLGSFFSEHIPYDPKLLADCVKAVGVREKNKYMRISPTTYPKKKYHNKKIKTKTDKQKSLRKNTSIKKNQM